MKPEPNRPVEHQRVIALLKEAQAPPADAETPAIPDEILDRLRGQYGRAPRRAVVADKPGLWAWLCDVFIQPKFAFATVLVLACGVAAVMLRSPAPQEELMRGGQVRPAAVPAYWLQSDQAEPAPGGLGLPKFIVITSRDALPAEGDALLFDPAHREARAMKGGSITAKIPIADPTDSNEWLTAHRQLSKQSAP
jgi:hypothetical protein